MHIIQQKLLTLAKNNQLSGLTLRGIGELIGVPNSPQKVKHHLDKLLAKELLVSDGQKGYRLAGNSVFDNSKFLSLPIYGSVNCGQASIFCDENLSGYLTVSKFLIGEAAKYPERLFVLRAVGNSMNQAQIGNNNIVPGDYVIVEKDVSAPNNGDYVVSNIDGRANIKKFFRDDKNHQIILMSESTQDFPPIYLHESDLDEYSCCGRVIGVFKQPDEERLWDATQWIDSEKQLPPLSQKEIDYYSNL